MLKSPEPSARQDLSPAPLVVIDAEPEIAHASPTPPAESYYWAGNHYLITDDQKDMVQRYGLQVRSLGDGRFQLTSQYSPDALYDLISPFMPESWEPGDAAIVNRKRLGEIAGFLRHPIGKTLGEKNRRSGHHIWRFATTGRVQIPVWVNEDMEDAASLACHLKGQRKAEEIAKWQREPELWHPDTEGNNVSSIPGSSYDPYRGFVFEIDPSLRDGAEFEYPEQGRLREIFWETLNEVTDNRYAARDADNVALDAMEFREFNLAATRNPAFMDLIRKVEIQQISQDDFSAIAAQSEMIKDDPRFTRALVAQNSSLTPEMKAKNLAMATTIFTPLLASSIAFEIWRHNNIMEQWLGLTDPIGEITKKASAALLTMQKQVERGMNGDIAALQATANRYRPLFALYVELIESLQAGADHKKSRKELGDEKSEELIAGFEKLKAALIQSSVNGVSIGENSSLYDEIAESFKNTMGQNGGLVRQQVVGYYEMMKGFWQGVGESMEDSPIVGVALLGLLAYAATLRYGGDAEAPQQVTTSSVTIPQGLGLDLDSGNFSTAGEQNVEIPVSILDDYRVAGEQIAAEAAATGEQDTCVLDKNCHYDGLPKFVGDVLDTVIGYPVGQYVRFRHYIGVDIIASGALAVQGLVPEAVEVTFDGYEALGAKAADNVSDANLWLGNNGYESYAGWNIQAPDEIKINENPVFMQTSKTVATTLGEFVVDANSMQDASHTSMIVFALAAGATLGPAAFRGMGGLSAEFGNPVYRMGAGIGGWGYRAGANYLARPVVNYMINPVAPGMVGRMSKRKGPRRHQRLIKSSMDLMAGPSAALEVDDAAPLAEAVQIKPAEIKLNIGWYGLKTEKVTIDSDNIGALENALNEFALALKYSAQDMSGIESEEYPEFVQERLNPVEVALQDYKAAQTPETLRQLQTALNGNLQHVIGAELKFTGDTKLYRTLFAEPEAPVKRRGFRRLKNFFTERADIKDARRHHVLARHASKKDGRMHRQEYRRERGEKIKALSNRFDAPERYASVQSLKYAWGAVADLPARYLWSRAIQGKSLLWGGIVNTAREGLQEPLNQLPHKKKIALTALAVGTGGVFADVAGFSNPLVSAASGGAAAVTTTGVTGIITGAINLPQDFFLHTGVVVVSTGVGAAGGYYFGRRLVKPTIAAAEELTRHVRRSVAGAVRSGYNALFKKPDSVPAAPGF